MFKGRLTKCYAKRFCEEYPQPKIAPREAIFLYTDLQGNKHQLYNGEKMFGPYQTWPVQIDDFALDISDAHASRNPNYETLKQIILSDNPAVVSRDYISREEYENTVEQCFRAVRSGIINGKLRTVIKRKTQQMEEEMSWLQRLFSSEEKVRKKVLQEPLIKNLVENFQASVPAYWSGIRNYGLD